MNDSNFPLVSVLIVVRNVEKEVKRCLESIFAQSYENLEIVLIDDFSNDRTVEVCEKFIKNYNSNIYVHLIKNSEHLGLTKNLNIGIDLCKGKYIARQDGDDWSHTDRIKKQVIAMEHNSSIDLLGTGFYLTDIFGVIKIPIIINKKIYSFEKYLTKQVDFFPHGSFLIKTSLLKFHLYNECCLFCQDIELLLWFSKNNFRIECLTDTLYFHRKPVNYNKAKIELKRVINEELYGYYSNNNSRFNSIVLQNTVISRYKNFFNPIKYYRQFLNILIINKFNDYRKTFKLYL
jgi:glycosyltransferase EpsE